MKKSLEKLKGTNIKELLKTIATISFMTLFLVNMNGAVVHASGSPVWGKNAFDFIKDTVQWVALAVVVVYSIRFIAKRAWVQFGGFVLLAGVVLFIIDTPQSLKNIGSTLWNLIFK